MGEQEEIAVLTAAGAPLPLVSARIVDDAMKSLPHDGKAQGELILRTPWLTPCYWKDRDASEALWQGGWLHTRDVATIDTHGIIRICDRLKDVIKTGGEWVSSLALESLIASIEGVAEVAVIGVPDSHWGERPIAVLIAADPKRPPTLDLVNTSLAEAVAVGHISRFALLDRVEVLDALPRTSVGKIDKKALRTRFGHQCR